MKHGNAKFRHLGLNAVFFVPGMGGMETYVQQLIPALLDRRPNLRITVFVNQEGRKTLQRAPWADFVELATHPQLGRPYARAASELTLLGRLARLRGVDVLHNLAMTGPLRSTVPDVVTIPDLIWLAYPDSLSRKTTFLWRVIVPRIARRADRILTFSHASRDEIVQILGVPETKVDVVSLGPGMEPATEITRADELRARLSLGAGPTLLTISSKVRHKNLLRLLEAMVAVRERFPESTLVMPGHSTPHEETLKRAAETLGVSANIRFCDWLPSSDIEGLYRAAACFVYPSLKEGFGLPVLEAMARGVPVACSNASSLPEVAGEAAEYFDPVRASEIAGAVLRLLEDPEHASRLASVARVRAAGFTWSATAEESLAAYERVYADRAV